MMQPIFINAKTISDAWFQLLWSIFDGTYTQAIQRGSFENEQYRRQYPGLGVYIEFPAEDMVPVIPPGLGIPSPTTREYIEEYFAGYIMDPELGENEAYKYSSRIALSLEKIISMLKDTPNTNHAVIEVAMPDDINLSDPPCLRLIDFKVIDGVLTMSVYFRSWDLWAGFPTNLGGMELLKQYVADAAGLRNGSMYAYSAGAHIYGYQEELARIRTMKSGKAE